VVIKAELFSRGAGYSVFVIVTAAERLTTFDYF